MLSSASAGKKHYVRSLLKASVPRGNSAVYLNSSQFQSFQSSHRFAPFKTFQTELGIKAIHREVLETDGTYALHEPSEACARNLTGENEALRSGFQRPGFLDTSSRCVISTHTIKILISQSGICRFSLETGCTDVETQAHARVLGL